MTNEEDDTIYLSRLLNNKEIARLCRVMCEKLNDENSSEFQNRKIKEKSKINRKKDYK